MARGLNKVILVGYLGAAPECYGSANGRDLAAIRLATTQTWRDKLSNKLQQQTEWHRVVFFGRLAEVAIEYLSKGSLIYVEGYLKEKKWLDKSGVTRYVVEIIAKEMNILQGCHDKNIDAKPDQCSSGDYDDYSDVIYNRVDKDTLF
ncbi:MAG: single-stranded DNA-binding protein [Coxiellaceae bacterium]|nr:single-stranded DNA-binding protein [Coxiellaceae bacterium]